MTNRSLAQSYLVKARVRLTILPVLSDACAYSDVIREAQELVELALKACSAKPASSHPTWHDVGGLVREYAQRFPDVDAQEIDRLATISGWLRKEREFAFYGDIDFIPTEQYDDNVARRAMDDATFVVSIAERVIPPA